MKNLEAIPWNEEEDEEEDATLVSATLVGGSQDTFIEEASLVRASGGDDGDESLAAAGGWLFAANGFSTLSFSCCCCCLGFAAAAIFIFTAGAVGSTIDPSIKGSAVTAGAAEDDDEDNDDDDEEDEAAAAAAVPPVCAVTSTDNFPAVATPKWVKAAVPIGPSGAFRVSTNFSNEAPEVWGPLDSTCWSKTNQEKWSSVGCQSRSKEGVGRNQKFKQETGEEPQGVIPQRRGLRRLHPPPRSKPATAPEGLRGPCSPLDGGLWKHGAGVEQPGRARGPLHRNCPLRCHPNPAHAARCWSRKVMHSSNSETMMLYRKRRCE